MGNKNISVQDKFRLIQGPFKAGFTVTAFRNFSNAPKTLVSSGQQLPFKTVFNSMDVRDSS